MFSSGQFARLSATVCWGPGWQGCKPRTGTAWFGLFGKAKKTIFYYSWVSIGPQNSGKGGGDIMQDDLEISPPSPKIKCLLAEINGVSANLKQVGEKLKHRHAKALWEERCTVMTKCQSQLYETNNYSLNVLTLHCYYCYYQGDTVSHWCWLSL